MRRAGQRAGHQSEGGKDRGLNARPVDSFARFVSRIECGMPDDAAR
jgi:hypothetical protein